MNPWIFWWHFWLTFWEFQTQPLIGQTPLGPRPSCPPPPSCPIINLERWKADHPSPGRNGATRGEAA